MAASAFHPQVYVPGILKPLIMWGISGSLPLLGTRVAAWVVKMQSCPCASLSVLRRHAMLPEERVGSGGVTTNL